MLKPAAARQRAHCKRQVPCPRDWAKVLMADSLAELVECTEIIMGGEHFLDS